MIIRYLLGKSCKDGKECVPYDCGLVDIINGNSQGFFAVEVGENKTEHRIFHTSGFQITEVGLVVRGFEHLSDGTSVLQKWTLVPVAFPDEPSPVWYFPPHDVFPDRGWSTTEGEPIHEPTVVSLEVLSPTCEFCGISKARNDSKDLDGGYVCRGGKEHNFVVQEAKTTTVVTTKTRIPQIPRPEVLHAAVMKYDKRIRETGSSERPAAEMPIPANGPPTTPGELLLKDYLEPSGTHPRDFGYTSGVGGCTVVEIIQGTASVTLDIAYQLGKALGTTPEFWLNAQAATDAYKARNS